MRQCPYRSYLLFFFYCRRDTFQGVMRPIAAVFVKFSQC